MRFCRVCGAELKPDEVRLCEECGLEDGEEDDDDIL